MSVPHGKMVTIIRHENKISGDRTSNQPTNRSTASGVLFQKLTASQESFRTFWSHVYRSKAPVPRFEPDDFGTSPILLYTCMTNQQMHI
jgi:hypothetical protein